jgi:hypothetical protein
MSAAPAVTLTLTRSQVAEIVRQVTPKTQGVFAQMLRVVASERFIEEARVFEDNPRLSRSLLTGLVVLSAFAHSRGPVGIKTLARTLDLNTSTTHRYVQTLLAVGFIVQDPGSRRYTIASVGARGGAGGG